jgi:extracellular elastinolytic metalloproteinase
VNRSSALRCALAAVGLLGAFAAIPSVAVAKSKGEGAEKQDKLAFFDSRQTPAATVALRGKGTKLAESPNPATVSLEDALGSEGIVAVDPLTATPRMVGKLDGFLTGASGNSAQTVALEYVRANAAAFNLQAADISNLALTRDYVSIDGTHHLFFQQKVNGVPVFGNGLKANVTRDGRLINVTGSPVVPASAGSTSPGISAGAATAASRADVSASVIPVKTITPDGAGVGPDVTREVTFANGDRTSLVYFQAVAGLRLAWQTYVFSNAGSYLHVVDAQTGRILYRRSLVQSANGLVFENYPGAANGGTQQSKSISDNGWLPANATTLSGPNTHVYTDVDDSNNPSNRFSLAEEIGPSGGGNWIYPVVPFTFTPALNAIYGCDTSLCTWNPFIAGPFPGNPQGFFSYQVNRAQSGTQSSG